MSVFRNLYGRFIKHIALEIATMEKNERPQNCVLGQGTRLGGEALIENHLGDRASVTVGSHGFVRGRLMTYGHGGRINIGNDCYIGSRTEIWSMERIDIGDRVLISHDVNIHDGTAHSMNASERHEHYKKILGAGHPRSGSDLPGLRSSRILIEDDVWISFGVTILKGVRIGEGSIIAANSVVFNDVPARTLYRNRVVPEMRLLVSPE